MTDRRILIASDSHTISSVLSKVLEDSGNCVMTVSDGMEAVRAIYRERPDCVILSSNLPCISGFDLSHLIRKNPQLNYLAIILCSSDETNDSRAWLDGLNCDYFYVPNPEKLESLPSIIDNAIGKRTQYQKNDPRELTEKDVLQILNSTYSQELFELYITRDAFNAENYIWDIEQLMRHMTNTIYNIYAYDALSVMINQDPLYEYFDLSDTITNGDFEDFRKICRNDFMNRIVNRKEYSWTNCITVKNQIETFSQKKEKIKTYNQFPMDTTKKYPFTVHIATTNSDSMNSNTQKMLDFLCGIYSPIIEKNIMLRRTIDAEQKIRNAFSRFLPPKVIEGIVAGETSYTSKIGEERQVAILMADIREFTAISEKTSPDRVIEFLNRYFSIMGNVIKKHGGTIDKFIGDEIMAIFGVPESYKYNGYRAANAALEMIHELESLDTSLLEIPEGKTFKVGIGIHYGHPIAGTIGSNDKKEYTVIGDDVNLASRVQDLTKLYGNSVLVTDEVKQDIEKAENDIEYGRYLNKHEHINFRFLDKVKVKGKSVAVELFELYSNAEKYSENFHTNYNKGLYQYLIGNFNGAQDYLRIAKVLMPKDRATKVILERCKTFAKNRPENWDGAVTLTRK